MILHANDYGHLVRCCPVVNSKNLDDYLNVRVPHGLSGYELYDILEISCSPARGVSMANVKFDSEHPWVDIPFENLNRTAGKHTYKLAFGNDHAKRYCNTYISYVVQDDDPQMDYIYMGDVYTEDDAGKQGIYNDTEAVG